MDVSSVGQLPGQSIFVPSLTEKLPVPVFSTVSLYVVTAVEHGTGVVPTLPVQVQVQFDPDTTGTEAVPGPQRPAGSGEGPEEARVSVPHNGVMIFVVVMVIGLLQPETPP